MELKRDNNNFDFIRLFGSMCIIFTHSFALLGRANEEPRFIFGNYRIGYFALIAFFSISGFLIAHSAANASSLKNYIWKRFLRVHPPMLLNTILIVTLLFILYAKPLSTLATDNTVLKIFKNIIPILGYHDWVSFAFINNPNPHNVNGSLWTLVLEERLYVLAFSFILFKKKWFKYILLAATILIYIFSQIKYTANLFSFISPYALGFVIYFFIGACIYYFQNNIFPKYTKAIVVIECVLLLLYTNLHIYSAYYMVFMPLLIIAFGYLPGKLNKFGKIGDYSYSSYIYAFFIQQIIIHFTHAQINPYLLFFTTCVLLIPICFLSWNYLEKKCLSYKNLIQ